MPKTSALRTDAKQLAALVPRNFSQLFLCRLCGRWRNNQSTYMKLPQRPEAHRLERDSVIFFESSIPRNWDTSTPASDYGVDLVVNIFDDDNASGREFLVQLKASVVSNATADGDFERIKISVATYNMLIGKLQVVMLVRYVAEEGCAYWQLLSQIEPPEQDNDTMTIRIPRSNVLSQINWRQIRSYVEHIQLQKLGRRERVDLESFV